MANKLRVLFVALEPFAKEVLMKHLSPTCEFTPVNTIQDFEKILETATDGCFDLILCGPTIPDIQPMEMAQAFRTQVPKSVIFFVPCQQGQLDFKSLEKNGFEQVFMLPAEEVLLGEALRKIERENTGSARVTYRSVPVMDFEPDTQVDFSVSIYLPMNKKHVKILKGGSRIEKNQIDKLKQHNMRSVSIDEVELDKFVTYSANQLKKLNKEGSSNIETQRKLQTTVRDLFRSVLCQTEGNFDEGKSLVESSQKIVSEFVNVKSAQTLHESLASDHNQDEDNIYAHSGRVATIASLLSLGTKIGKPEDLAIAGLFHDMGKIKFSQALLEKPYAKMTPDEQKEFAQYPNESLNVLAEKKMGVSPKVRSIILQQCERADAKGFPKQMNLAKIEPEAQLLAVANDLDVLMSVREGEKKMTIEEAFRKIEESGAIGPDTLSAVRSLLFPPKTEAA